MRKTKKKCARTFIAFYGCNKTPVLALLAASPSLLLAQCAHNYRTPAELPTFTQVYCSHAHRLSLAQSY